LTQRDEIPNRVYSTDIELEGYDVNPELVTQTDGERYERQRLDGEVSP